MSPLLLLYQRPAIFDFHDENIVEEDIQSIIEYFDTNSSEKIELRLEPILCNYIDVPFNGDLRSFNELKIILKNLFKEISERKFY